MSGIKNRESSIKIQSTRYAELSIDPSTSLRMIVRAGPNRVDRVLGDKERRLTEIYLK